MSFADVTLQLLEAARYTLGLFFLTLIIAIPLGVLVCACAMSRFKPVKWLTNVFIWIIRGTPLMLQIIVVFYGPSLIALAMQQQFGMDIDITAFNLNRFTAAVIAFAINYAAYFAEIYRGGIMAMPNGQYEAGKVLGMSRAKVNGLVIFPQVVKKITPAMSNEVITLVKDTSLANIIAIPEIIKTAQNMVSTKAIIWPLFYTGIFYLAMCGLLTLFFKWLEKRTDYYKA